MTSASLSAAERLQLTANVAQWYFVEGLSQEKIGVRTGLSRVTVARLLDEAKRLKIVEIAVKPPIPTVPELEARLARSFGLQLVRVCWNAAPRPRVKSCRRWGAWEPWRSATC